MRSLIVAFQGLRGAPVRSILVVLALTLGMLGFVAVLSADQVMRETVIQRALLTGGKEPTFEASVKGPESQDEVATAIRQLKSRSGATHSAARIDDPDVGVWTNGLRVDNLKIVFVTSSLIDIHPFPLVSGEWFESEPALAPRVLVNEAAAAQLSAHGAAQIGSDYVKRKMVVVGVIRDALDEPQVYASVRDYFEFAEQVPTVTVALHGPALTDSAVTAAARHLASLGARIELASVTQTDRISALSSEIATTSRVLFVLGALSLSSTIVGIMNVGLATARARAKEFALRRTMGASRGNVAFIVMLESQILALSAALVAFGGSYLLFPVVVGAFNTQLGVSPPPYDPAYGIICLAVASATALLSSFAPALLSYGRDLSSVMRE
ncbi:FtsX-like permease family protein [Microbacterium sp. Mu-80]|uniref:FtsX-like permease family protein n=1 Tax=Microbacterium bandirmense TaxID=3122050 RepID=A0ABU8LCG2_9MICO